MDNIDFIKNSHIIRILGILLVFNLDIYTNTILLISLNYPNFTKDILFKDSLKCIIYSIVFVSKYYI